MIHNSHWFRHIHEYLHKHYHPFEHLTYGAIIALILLGIVKLNLFVLYFTTPKLRWSLILAGFVLTLLSSFYYEGVLKRKK